MSTKESPYISTCGFCEQGMLRFMRCSQCDAVCAVCDECELIWKDIAVVHEDPKSESASSFPTCPACDKASERWRKLDRDEVNRAKLHSYVAGESV